MEHLFDQQTERTVLAAFMLDPTLFAEHGSLLAPWHFTQAAHIDLFTVMRDEHREHDTFDLTALTQHGTDTQSFVAELMSDPIASMSLTGRHAARVAQLALQRRTIEMMGAAQTELQDRIADPREMIESLARRFDEVAAMIDDKSDDLFTYEEWARMGESEQVPWVIPGMLRAESRLMLLAPEGMGKSTLLRQIALLCAAGMHPLFPSKRIEPRRVLIVDVENDPRYAVNDDGTVDRASPLGLLHTVQNMIDANDDLNRCRVLWRPEGLDLRTAHDEQLISRAMRDHQPELTIIGPVYRLASKAAGENDENVTAALQQVLDRLRTTHKTAMLIEHHQPKQSGATSKRNATPFGSSLWMRWPDIGLTLEQNDDHPERFDVKRFRGHRYPVPGMPSWVERGQQWPWIGRFNRPMN